MNILKSMWKKCSYLGIDDRYSSLEIRKIIVTNRLNLVASILFVIILILNLTKFDPQNTGSLKLGLTLLVCMVIFVLSYKKLHLISKIVFTTFPISILLFTPLFFHHVIDEFYLWYSYTAVGFSILPHMLFSFKNEKIPYIVTFFYCLVLVLFSEILLTKAGGQSLPIVPIIQANIIFYKGAQIAIFIFLNLAFLYTLRLNRLYENKLETANKCLQENSNLIKVQSNENALVNEELVASNEKLYNINKSLNNEIEIKLSTQQQLEDYKNKLEELVNRRTHELFNEKEYNAIILDSIQNLVLVLDPNGNIVSYNKYFEEMTDYNSQDLKGKNLISLFYSEEEKNFARNIISNIQDGNFLNTIEHEFVTRKGQKKSILWRNTRFLNDFGEMKYLICAGTDLTERKQLELTIEESEIKYRNIFESIKDGIVISKFTQELIEVNPSMYEITGYLPDSKNNLKTTDIIHPKYHKKIANRLEKLSRGIDIPAFEVELHGKNNTLVPVELNTQMINYRGEKALLTIVRDITERKNAIRELQASERKFKNVFNSTKDGIIISSLENQQIIEVNNTFLIVAGYTEEEVITHKTIDYLSSVYIDKINERFKELKEGKRIPSLEIELKTKDNSKIPVELNSLIIEYNGELAVLSILKDIREQKELEKLLFNTIIQTEEAERKRLAADLHDEIGPLLSSMGLYISTLTNQEKSESTKKILNKVLGIIKNASNGVREISHNLSPQYLENYGLHLALKSEIEQRIDFVKINFQSNLENIRLEEKLEVIIYRIVKELLNNTLKHTSATIVDFSVNYNNNILFLHYYDNGEGFNFNDLNSRKYKGIGLLNIISRIKSLGGSYNIITNKGEGFTFEMSVATS